MQKETRWKRKFVVTSQYEMNLTFCIMIYRSCSIRRVQTKIKEEGGTVGEEEIKGERGGGGEREGERGESKQIREVRKRKRYSLREDFLRERR